MAVKEMSDARALLSPLTSTSIQSASFNSNVFNIQQFSNVGFQVNITNPTGLTGTVVISGSLDGTNFVPIPSSSQSFTVSTTSLVWTYANLGLIFTRVEVAITAGSGQFQAYGFAKTQ